MPPPPVDQWQCGSCRADVCYSLLRLIKITSPPLKIDASVMEQGADSFVKFNKSMQRDGVVALVSGRGTLSLTLLAPTHRHALSPRSSGSRRGTARDSAAQACDGHYTTTYQLSHCNMSPTSPAPHVPEFPPQRARPSHLGGNFQVGSFRSVPEGESHSRRGGTTHSSGGQPTSWSVTGCSCSGIASPRDTFAASLRRYPHVTSLGRYPHVTSHAALLQRLLAHAQDKLSRSPLRSQRSRATSPPTRATSPPSPSPPPVPPPGTAHEPPTRDSWEEEPPSRRRRKNWRRNRESSRRELEQQEGQQTGADRGRGQDALRHMMPGGALTACHVCPTLKQRYTQHQQNNHQPRRSRVRASSGAQEPSPGVMSRALQLCAQCLRSPPCPCELDGASPALDPALDSAPVPAPESVPPGHPTPAPEPAATRSPPDRAAASTLSPSRSSATPARSSVPTPAPGRLSNPMSASAPAPAASAAVRAPTYESESSATRAPVPVSVAPTPVPTTKARTLSSPTNLSPACSGPASASAYMPASALSTSAPGRAPTGTPAPAPVHSPTRNMAATRAPSLAPSPAPGLATTYNYLPSSPHKDSLTRSSPRKSVPSTGRSLRYSPTHTPTYAVSHSPHPTPVGSPPRSHTDSQPQASPSSPRDVPPGSPLRPLRLCPSLVREMEDQTHEWLAEVPVYPDDTEDDKLTREHVIRRLIDSLTALNDPREFEARARELIEKCVDDMPMWNPTKVDRRLIASRLADDLFDRLTTTRAEHDDYSGPGDVTRQFPNDKRKLWGRQRGLQRNISNEISELINDIPNDVNTRVKDEITQKIAEAITPCVQDLSKNTALLEEILFILKRDALMSELDATNLSSAIVNRVNGMPPSDAQPTSSDQPAPGAGGSDQSHLMEKEILDFIDDATGIKCARARRRRKEPAGQLARTVLTIHDDPQATDKEDRIIAEVSEYVRKLSIDVDTPRNELARQLASRLGRPSLTASTQGIKPTSNMSDSIYNNTDTDSVQTVRHNSQVLLENDEQNYTSELIDAIHSWLEEIGVQLEEAAVRDLAADVIDRQKYLQLNPDAKVSPQEELAYLKFQVYRWLNKFTDDDQITPIMAETEALMSKINKISVPKLVKLPPVDYAQFLTSVLLAWLKQNQLYESRCCQERRVQERIVMQLVEELAPALERASAGELSDLPDILDIIMQGLKQFSMRSELKADDNFIRETAVELLEYLNGFSIFRDALQSVAGAGSSDCCGWLQYARARHGATDVQGNEPAMKQAADILFEVIEQWCESLPIEADTADQLQRAKQQKQHIASKLINKLQHLNMNPEIICDDFLYEDLLQDELDELLATLASPNVQQNAAALKKNLIDNIKAPRDIIRDEYVAQAYKQKLRDEISKTLPLEQITEDEQADFELLKDGVIDAFINLHVVGDNELLKHKYKNKIRDEVDKFCNDYLKKHPSTPFDTAKLNRDLYRALNDVPVPNEDTFIHEVELIRTKDVITEWLRELPLPRRTGKETLQTNKTVSILAKKLNDIERDKRTFPEVNYDDKIKREVTKWLKKLPLGGKNDEDLNRYADVLMNKLNDTIHTRRGSAVTRYSIDSGHVDASVEASGPACACEPTLPPCALPPCSLTAEERAHLDRIRERAHVKATSFKDASVNPIPVEAGSQTEVRPARVSSGSGPTLGRSDERASCPHIVVKEYYWDSPDTSSSSCRRECPRPPRLQPCPAARDAGSGPGVSQASCRRAIHGQSADAAPHGIVSPQPSQYSHRSQKQANVSSSCVPPPGICIMNPPCPPPPSPCVRPPCGRARSPRPCPRRQISDEEVAPTYEAGSSVSCPRRVGHIGSYHEAPCPTPDEQYWDNRPVIPSAEDFDRRFREEIVRCKCKERTSTRWCKRGKSPEPVQRCPKCSGYPCPYPTYMFFKQ